MRVRREDHAQRTRRVGGRRRRRLLHRHALRAEIEARGDLETTTAIVGEEMEARLGSGAVTGKMAAIVFEATPAA